MSNRQRPRKYQKIVCGYEKQYNTGLQVAGKRFLAIGALEFFTPQQPSFCDKFEIVVKHYKSRTNRNGGMLPTRNLQWMLKKETEFLCGLHQKTIQKDSFALVLDDDDWEDIADFAFFVVTGFDIPFFGSDNNDEDFKELNDRLDAISTKLDQLSAKLDSVLTALQELPEEIRGMIRIAQLTQYMADQKTHTQLLRPYMQDKATFNAPDNLTNIQSLIVKLAEDVGRIISATGGKMAGFSMSAPGFAVWAQAQTMVLNIKSTNPSGQTIWDQDFYADSMAMIRDLFNVADKLSKKYAADLPYIPGGKGSMWQYKGGNSFKPYNPGQGFQPDLYLASGPPIFKQWSLSSSYRNVPQEHGHPPMMMFLPATEQFFHCFAHPDLVRQAASLWNTQIPELNDSVSFYRSFSDFETIRDKVYAATAKPHTKRR